MSTPNSRFEEFLSDINPSKTTISHSKLAHETIRDVLRSDEDFNDRLIESFLGGSYARSTAIRPKTSAGKTERPDVDIYVVMQGTRLTVRPDELIDNLYSALNRNRSTIKAEVISRNRCSISITTNNADIDISPLLNEPNNDYYLIGNRYKTEWYYTDPRGHIEWSSQENKLHNGKFKPLVKMLKWARRENPTKHRHPKSVALEVLLSRVIVSTSGNYGEILRDTFHNFIETYAIDRACAVCPHLPDPSVISGDILGGVTADEFCTYYDKIKNHLDSAENALLATTGEVATEKWREIFGERFPSSKNKLGETGLKSAVTIPVIGFPDEPSTPPNTPSDFA